jgi:rRNA-processing protein FCF1
MKTILDTSFIVSAVGNGMDFIEELYLEGLVLLVPEQVFWELEKIIKSTKKAKYRKNAELALKILQNNKSKYKPIDLGRGHTDKRILKYIKEHPRTAVATLDKEIQKAANRYVVIKNRKRIEIM